MFYIFISIMTICLQKENFTFSSVLGKCLIDFKCSLKNICNQIWTATFAIDYYPAKNGILQSPSCVCLFVCLFVSRISHKLLVGFWWNVVSTEVMIRGWPSSKLGVILIEIRIWDPDNCFSWTTGRILMKFGELGLL